MIEAILCGERDTKKLEPLLSSLCQSDRKHIEKALTGDFRPEYLFELRDCYDLYNYYWAKIDKTDKEIEELLTIHTRDNKQGTKPKNIPGKRKQANKNDPKPDVISYANRMADGVDLSQIPGVSVGTVLTMISETGFDLSIFKSAKHCVSWLGLTPNRKITGGKVSSSKTCKQTSPLARILREAANTAGNSKTRLGDFFRRLACRKGRLVAILATARKIGVIFYKML